MRIASVSLYAFALLTSLPPGITKQVLDRQNIRQSTDVDENMLNHAFDLLQIGYDLERRATSPQRDAPTQSPTEQNPPTETSESTPPPVFDEQQFNASATVGCLEALGDLKRVVNPSGMAACFNIPFFDNKTGAFEADIRVYQVTEAVGEFSGIPPSEYTLQMNIPEATISDPRRLVDGTRNRQKEMALLQEFRHFGQISTLLQLEKLTQDDIRVLLIPNITIGAPNPKRQQLVMTTLSSDTLSYVAGFFTNEDNSPVNITIPEARSRLPDIVSAATAFVLPGTNLGIFPTGLIITSIWAGAFLGAVGYGTLTRMKFRDHYRRRLLMAAARAEGNARI
ncbi:hypothetical protein AJ78_01541 [Emergomyces pasteurianus Ep9510]|uniref:Protein BIG1 n=1 Tax=Emergomyces pasteurianus Ep9510 TaxID=1447872 RepID=A0A1J9PQE9_9EURO|nr:hypothetical protein AJ78_01541 [Emergomyces pasteurianus Ep9510]